MSYDFTDKRALVTGASRGIGKEIVRQLTKYGAKVYALSRNPDNLASLKIELPSVTTVCVDIGNWDETRKAVDEIGDIDLLVNNAGVVEVAKFPQVTEEQFDRLFAVNVKAVINISQVITEKLKKKGKQGSIVNVSSLASLKTVLDVVVYGMSKAALDKLTKSMAIELSKYRIRVNSVNPTATATDMFMKRLEDASKKVDDIKKHIPLGDICSAEDVADSVLFLLSEKARMITGTVLAVDGGRTAT